MPYDGYRFVEWLNPDGSHYSYEPHMRIHADEINGDTLYTAVFQKITSVEIYYQANALRDTLSRSSEHADLQSGAVGCEAWPRTNYRFVGWMDDNGSVVSSEPLFVPTGSQVYEGATYTAVFEPDIYNRYLTISTASVDGAVPGRVTSADYNNSVNGYVTSMYIREDGTIPAALTAVAYDEYLFDHWELNVVPLSFGSTIPAGTDLSASAWNGMNQLVACYRHNPNVPVYHVYYVADPAGGGRVSRGADTWTGSDTSTVHGATAQAYGGYAFAGWIERTSDPSVVLPIQGSNYPTFVPQGDQLKDGATYYAVFRSTGQNSGLVGYNMNLYNTPVHWDGVKDSS